MLNKKRTCPCASTFFNLKPSMLITIVSLQVLRVVVKGEVVPRTQCHRCWGYVQTIGPVMMLAFLALDFLIFHSNVLYFLPKAIEIL
jgi:hypothetical protein